MDEVERVQDRLVEEYIPEVTQFLDAAYAALTELDTLEEMILTAIGLSWHWDTAGTGLSPFVYRQLIRQMFEAHDFVEYLTTDPDIRMDPANVLLVRIGNRINQQAVNQFINRLLDTPDILQAI